MALGAVVAAIICCGAIASELDKLKLGTAISGTKPEKEALKGKAVFVELWGIH
jgi:hypothetical protein